ncbi:unnamed protein product, partial [Laminaria digitata]
GVQTSPVSLLGRHHNRPSLTSKQALLTAAATAVVAMAMGLGERVKPLLLATLLVFMVGSYFVSDTFKRGASIDRVWVDIAHLKTVSKSVCARRPKQELAACQASIAEALVVTNLACMGPIRDAFACENPTSGKNQGEESCGEETIRLFECIPVHLEPQLQRRGFSGEEIADFVFGSEGLTKQHPAPTAGEGQGQGG